MSLPDEQPLDVPVSTTELATDAWEALFRAQVSVLRRLAADDVWDQVTMREYDVLFTLSLAPSLSEVDVAADDRIELAQGHA
ncbi:hypothetical protein ABT116_49885, partial [Streptomyces sp. NPDC002130]